MRILFLQDWNPLHGGAERYALELRAAFASAGHELRLLAADASEQARESADYLAFASDQALPKALLQLHNPLAAAAVRRAVRDFRPHVALVNMFALYLSPAALRALRPLPWVLLVSDYKITCPLGHRLLPNNTVCSLPRGRACLGQGCLPPAHWLRDQVRYRLIEQAIRRAAAVVSTSEDLRSVLAVQGFESQCVPLFSSPPPENGVRSPAPRPLFLYLGRLDVEKGVDELLSAFARLRKSIPDCRLRIVGRGAQQGALERQAHDLGLAQSVDFCGWKAPHELEAEFARAWALVAPSRWPEPFGLVALEAIFRGLPAVVPDQGGFRETVAHETTGLKYPPGDVAALASALACIARGEAFAPTGVQPAEVNEARRQYSRERHVAELEEILARHAIEAT